MAQFPFSKYSGCGNDFILIDHRRPFFPVNDRPAIQKLCHRQKGIGADGVIFLEASSGTASDFKMRIFNSDGSEAEMCGNGIRCLAQFIADLGLPQKPYAIETMQRLLRVEHSPAGIRAAMGTPADLRQNLNIEIDGTTHAIHYLDTGVPHAVLFVDDLENAPVESLGRKIRHHAAFKPKGANANFVQVLGPHSISLRTYERGVEAETLACGTGATAAAIIAFLQKQVKTPIEVKTRSNETLIINFAVDKSGTITDVSQTGPAVKHFHGVFEGTL